MRTVPLIACLFSIRPALSGTVWLNSEVESEVLFRKLSSDVNVVDVLSRLLPESSDPRNVGHGKVFADFSVMILESLQGPTGSYSTIDLFDPRVEKSFSSLLESSVTFALGSLFSPENASNMENVLLLEFPAPWMGSLIRDNRHWFRFAKPPTFGDCTPSLEGIVTWNNEMVPIDTSLDQRVLALQLSSISEPRIFVFAGCGRKEGSPVV
jgi:hypothetical protein